MGNYTILKMFKNPRRGRQARNFTANVPKILVLKQSSEQIFTRKLPLGAPERTLAPMALSSKNFSSNEDILGSLNTSRLLLHRVTRGAPNDNFRKNIC